MMIKPLAAMVFAALALLAPGSARAEPVRIVAFGDSLMAGYQLGPEEGFVPQLQKALDDQGIEASIGNAGVSGDTTSGGLARLDWSVADGTDLVILELGANDALRGIAPELTRQNLDAMITRLKDRGITVLLAGMIAPPNMGPDYGAAFNPVYADLAARHGLTLYPFFLDGVAATPALQLADGMHPNAAGVARMVDGILPVLLAEIKNVKEINQ
ncbi:MAG: arylesterase [Brucellaceae bacterium]|nr:arylesterase [Brucellaceae bacterium]